MISRADASKLNVCSVTSFGDMPLLRKILVQRRIQTFFCGAAYFSAFLLLIPHTL